MMMKCKNCGRDVPLPQERPLHAGFSNVGVLYCDSHLSTLTFSTFDVKYAALVGEKHPWALSSGEKARVEEALRACPCGGRFRFDQSPKCPECRSDLIIDLTPIYFYIVGDHVNGESEDVWR